MFQGVVLWIACKGANEHHVWVDSITWPLYHLSKVVTELKGIQIFSCKLITNTASVVRGKIWNWRLLNFLVLQRPHFSSCRFYVFISFKPKPTLKRAKLNICKLVLVKPFQGRCLVKTSCYFLSSSSSLDLAASHSLAAKLINIDSSSFFHLHSINPPKQRGG